MLLSPCPTQGPPHLSPASLLKEVKGILLRDILMLNEISLFFRRAEMKSRHDEIRKKYGKGRWNVHICSVWSGAMPQREM